MLIEAIRVVLFVGAPSDHPQNCAGTGKLDLPNTGFPCRLPAYKSLLHDYAFSSTASRRCFGDLASWRGTPCELID